MKELSLHIIDLVQNSVEAGATQVILSIDEDKQNDLLTISVVDNGKGMQTTDVAKVSDPFFTSRTTRKVGLGLALIEMSTRQCNGLFTILSEPHKGTVVEARYQYSHIDRPPLGNIVDTIRNIVVGYTELDFDFYYHCDKKEFCFRTCKIKEILGDVSVSHPEVINWLGEYLAENLNESFSNVEGGK